MINFILRLVEMTCQRQAVKIGFLGAIKAGADELRSLGIKLKAVLTPTGGAFPEYLGRFHRIGPVEREVSFAQEAD